MSGHKTSNVYCAVFGCKTFYANDKTISFHWFPKEREGNVPWTNKYDVVENIVKRRAWAINLKIDRGTLKKISLRICSKHSTDEDYFASNLFHRRNLMGARTPPNIILGSPNYLMTNYY